MNNKLKLIILGSILSIAFGQNETKYGIGFNVEINGINSLIQLIESGDNSSVNGIYFPIEKDGYLFEPSVSYMTSSTLKDYNEDSFDSERTESNITALLGLFKLYERDKVRFKAGLRTGKTWFSEKSKYSNEDEEIDKSDLLFELKTIISQICFPSSLMISILSSGETSIIDKPPPLTKYLSTPGGNVLKPGLRISLLVCSIASVNFDKLP